MAIINKFEVAIESHGGNLPEYDDNNADQPEWIRSYYVQASPATRFSIRLTLAPGFAFYPPTDFLTAKIWIDGVRVNSLVLMKHKYCPWRGATVRKSAITVASGDITVKRLLVFGKLGTFEGDTLQNSNDLNSEYGQLGTIRVEVWRKVTICREKGHSPATTFTGKDSAPETALKGDSKSVSVQLGDVLGFQPIKHLRTGVRTRDEPDAIFSFKCRSLGALVYCCSVLANEVS